MHEARKKFTPVQEKPVTTDTRPFEEMTAIAKQAKEQALAVTDDYFNFLRKTISSYPSGATEFGKGLKGYAEKNIIEIQEFVHKLSEAKDFQEVFRLQTEFMQAQFAALSEETQSLGEAYSKSAASAVSKVYKNVA
jgi:phasin family protein